MVEIFFFIYRERRVREDSVRGGSCVYTYACIFLFWYTCIVNRQVKQAGIDFDMYMPRRP